MNLTTAYRASNHIASAQKGWRSGLRAKDKQFEKVPRTQKRLQFLVKKRKTPLNLKCNYDRR